MDTTTDKEILRTALKPRNAFVAFLLSIFIPGLGQMYNGQLKKGAFLFFSLFFFNVIFCISNATHYFYGLATLFAIEIFLSIYIIIDAIRYARRQKEYVRKKYNTWYYHLIFASLVLTIVWTYDPKSIFGIETFRMPTSSSQPTIQLGDWVVGDMKAYQKNDPNYGDLIIYKKDDGYLYTSRIVGLPNDQLEINDNIVSINGKKSKVTFIKEAVTDNVAAKEFEEELINGHKHKIYKFKQTFDSTMTNIKGIKVPPNSYYILGDNRDNSADSRYIGFITKQEIYGRIIYSYWGKSMDRINISFTDK